jgi:methylmalonyl-CoA/ethylmalonyl-CoA epimerase
MSGEEASLPVGMAGLRYPITQISLAVRDLGKTMEQYYRAFGWAPWQVFDHVKPMHHHTELRGQPVDYSLRGAEVYVGSLNFELLQPLDGPNLWSEFMDRRGEGIASIATMFLERKDGDAVKKAFKDAFDIDVIMKADIGDHIEYYYLDTEEKFGCPRSSV